MSPTRQNAIYISTFISIPTLSSPLDIRHGALWVDERGVIGGFEEGVGSHDEARVAALIEKLGWKEGEVKVVKVTDGDWKKKKGRSWIMPGFVDTHIHASQWPNAGIFGSSTLLDWLQTYTFPLEASLSDPKKANRVYRRAIQSTLKHGTTTACYYATTHVDSTNLLAQLCLDMGQRAWIGRCNQNSHIHPEYYRDESTASAVADTKACIEYCRRIDPAGDLVQPILTPRFAPSCTPDLLVELGKMAGEDPTLRIQTHIAENKPEVKLVGELFPKAANYASVYDDVGLLTDRTILAHSVHLSDDEIVLVKARDAKVSHCPPSNSSLGSGLCPVRKLLDAKIDVGLGTDVSGGYSASILEAARQAAMVSRLVGFYEKTEEPKLAVSEILYLATKGGAKVVGLQDKIGGFEPGMEFDAQLIELDGVGDEGEEGEVGGDVDVFGWESEANLVAKWFYGGDSRNVRAVWVQGRLVHSKVPNVVGL